MSDLQVMRSDDAERALLGSVLMRGAAEWREVCESSGLTPDDFATPGLSETAEAIDHLAATGEDVTAITVHAAMPRHGTEKLGGLGGVCELDKHATPLPSSTLALEVVRAAARRRMHAWHRECAERLEQDEELAHRDAWSEWTAKCSARHANLSSSGKVGDESERVSDVLKSCYQDMIREATGTGQSVPTGFRELDRLLGGNGPRPGWLVVVAGRPKMGKTSFALSLTREAVMRRVSGHRWAWRSKGAEGTPVLWACGEMPNHQLAQRIAADLGDLDGRAVASPSTNWLKHNLGHLEEIRKDMETAPLSFVPDVDSNSMDRIFSCARRWRAKHQDVGGKRPPAILVIDYLQRMRMAGMAPRASREEITGEMAKACKTLALELEIIVVLLAQINRGPEQRDDKRPRMSDLRDSGQIEQEADAMLGCYRDIVYSGDEKELRLTLARCINRDDHATREEAKRVRAQLQGAEVIVMGQRHGPTGTANIRFAGEHFRFYDPPHRDEDEQR